jgi:hypothetical protein
VYQLLGEKYPPGLGYRDRGSAKMLPKQTSELTFTNSQPCRQDLTFVLSRPSASINWSARDTVFELPRQKASSGDISGRQRKQGRNPASSAAAAVGKKRTFSRFGVGAGQIGRQ